MYNLHNNDGAVELDLFGLEDITDEEIDIAIRVIEVGN